MAVFEEVFLSPRNSQFVFDMVWDYITKKYENHMTVLQQHIFVKQETYKGALTELQQYIYANFFEAILQEEQKNPNTTVEDVVIQLNKLAISKFEYIVSSHINNILAPSPQQPQIQAPQAPQAPQTQQPQTQLPQIQASQQPQTQQPQIQAPQTQQPQTQQPQTQLPQIQAPQQPQAPQAPQAQAPQAREGEPVVLKKKFVYVDSDSSSFEDGRYTFKTDIPAAKSINLVTFRLYVNIYNITDRNNKIHVHENSTKTEISIPIGYYKLESLLTHLQTQMNIHCKHGFYTIAHNKLKNKIYISSQQKTQKENPNNFKLTFLSADLQGILGFSKKEYMNNCIYVSEQHPTDTTGMSLFVKTFINGQIVPQIVSHDNGWMYSHLFNLDMDKYFGNTFVWEGDPYPSPSFMLHESTDLTQIAFEFWISRYKKVSTHQSFCAVLELEYE